MTKRLLLAGALGAGVIGAPLHAASLGGDTVVIEFFRGGSLIALSSAPLETDPSFFISINGDEFSATLSDDGIVISYDLTITGEIAAETLWRFSDLDFTPEAEVTGLTPVSGAAALISGTGFGPDEISIAIAPYAAQDFSTLQTWEFAFTTGAPGAEVPLPAALPLSLAGLAALGLVARRRG